MSRRTKKSPLDRPTSAISMVRPIWWKLQRQSALIRVVGFTMFILLDEGTFETLNCDGVIAQCWIVGICLVWS